MKMKTMLAGCVVAAALVGCGGGGGGSSTTPVPVVVPSMEGYWLPAETSATQALGVVTGTDAWFIGSDSTWFVRAHVTTSTANGSNSFVSVTDDSFHYALDPDGTTATGAATTVSGTYIAKTSISGTLGADVRTPETNPGTIALTYASAFEDAASLDSASGTWVGTYNNGEKELSLEISASTVTTGTSTTGCSYAGTLSPHTSDAVFDFSVTETCVGGAETQMSGIAFLMSGAQPNNVFVFAATGDTDKTKGALFVGVRQQ